MSLELQIIEVNNATFELFIKLLFNFDNLLLQCLHYKFKFPSLPFIPTSLDLGENMVRWLKSGV
jgi:hypothetical protein